MPGSAQNGGPRASPSAPPGSMFRSAAVADADLHIGGRSIGKAEAGR